MGPSEDDFKIHFECLLNPSVPGNVRGMNFDESPCIPILDDPLHINEVSECIKEIKSNKACDLNGISPGIFKYLPLKWIITLVFLMNVAFNVIFLPSSWLYSKLVILFKKGSRNICDNYRGISINDTSIEYLIRSYINV